MSSDYFAIANDKFYACENISQKTGKRLKVLFNKKHTHPISAPPSL